LFGGRRGPRELLALLAAIALLLDLAIPAAAITARVVASGSRTQPVVALTFDDGDSPTAAAAILATLRAANVPATFFPYADAMRADPAVWHRIAAAGYPIGNHSVSHRELTRLSDATLRYEIQGATTLITQLSGRPPINVLRPPYGSWNGRVAAAAAAGGYPTLFLWDVDPRDWSGISAPTITSRVLGAARDGSVILLHAGPYHTPEALPAIIAGLRARGFGFVTVPQLLHSEGIGPVTGVGGQIGSPRSVPLALTRLAQVAAPVRPTPSHPLGHPALVVDRPRVHIDPRLVPGASIGP
jgi:peptidoglycan/xylan/chitin deacetylase (PgdA/CDA1 family)